ncbi:MAG: hypothetical protein ABL876_00235 [Chitinophagaceae bacterium]
MSNVESQREFNRQITNGRNIAIVNIMEFFTFEHIQNPDLQDVAGACAQFACDILSLIETDSAELTTGLRKLLEAKDCFVRAAIAPF